MVEYKCFRCGYTTTHKGSLVNHLNRKNICSPLLEDISIENIKKMYNFKNYTKEPKITQNEPKITQNDPFLNNAQNPKKPKITHFSEVQNPKKPKITHFEHICEFCKKSFNRNWHLSRHLNNCKKKKENENEKDKKIEELIKNQEIMKEQMKEMVEKLLINNSGNTTTNNNTTNNTTNNHNTIHNTININNYGNENIKYLRKDYLNNLLQGAFTAIPKLIEKIHFNPKHPENHNIKITNKKEPYVKVRKNDKWEFQDKKEILENLVDEKYYILEEHYAEVEENEDIPEKTKNVMGKFRDKFIDDKELHKDLQKKSEMIILNNS